VGVVKNLRFHIAVLPKFYFNYEVLPDMKKGSICLKEEEALQLLPFFNLKVLVRYGVPLLKEANEMWFISD